MALPIDAGYLQSKTLKDTDPDALDLAFNKFLLDNKLTLNNIERITFTTDMDSSDVVEYHINIIATAPEPFI